jgi:hypothetical protein
MGRSPCCEKVGLKKGPWTPEEDQKLIAYIEEFGHGSWRALPAKAVYMIIYVLCITFFLTSLLTFLIKRASKMWKELQTKMD